jgi:phage gp36-like protein
MAYCTINDIVARIPENVLKQLTQVDVRSNEINDNVVVPAISDSTALINSKLCRRYILPLSDSGILVRLSVDIAIYYIYRNRFDNKVPEEIKSTYDDAIKLLDDIRDGRESLPGAVEVPTRSFIVKTNKRAEDRVFTDSSMKTL